MINYAIFWHDNLQYGIRTGQVAIKTGWRKRQTNSRTLSGKCPAKSEER